MVERGLPPGMTPRLLTREQAAQYVGLRPDSFDKEVNAGTFPDAVAFKGGTRRTLWDRRALDLALDRQLMLAGLIEGEERYGWAARKAAWKGRQEGRSQAARGRNGS